MILFKWIYFYSYWWNIFWRDTQYCKRSLWVELYTMSWRHMDKW